MTPLEMAERAQKKAIGKDYTGVIEVLCKTQERAKTQG